MFCPGKWLHGHRQWINLWRPIKESRNVEVGCSVYMHTELREAAASTSTASNPVMSVSWGPLHDDCNLLYLQILQWPIFKILMRQCTCTNMSLLQAFPPSISGGFVWVGPVYIPALGTKCQLTEVRQTDYFLKLPLFKRKIPQWTTSLLNFILIRATQSDGLIFHLKLLNWRKTSFPSVVC